MICDLHIHTNLSDGKSTFNEVIERSMKKNVKIISITDHNRIDNYYNLIKPADLKIINGVEISVLYNNYEYHFLMYGFDPYNKHIIKYNNDSIKHSKKNFNNYCISLEELFELEHNTNSIVSLAHPTKYFNNIDEIEKFILFLKKEYNLRAVECYNTSASVEQQDKLIKISNKHDLYISGGSDYHGKPPREIGYANRLIYKDYLSILNIL